MATTQLSDLYSPLVFDEAVAEKFDELNAFLRSGVLVDQPMLSDMASVGGFVGEMPFFKPLDASSEPDYTNDNPAAFSTPANITTGTQKYRLAKMHKSWSTMDFARELGLAGMDPLEAITTKVAKYWAIQEEKRLIASGMGIMADNVANDAGDMVEDIYSDIAAPVAANIISAEAIQDAKQTSGDHQGEYTAIGMHSVTFNTLNKANLIDFIPNSEGRINFPTYLGLAVVVDDSLPVVSGVNSPAYITILYTPGSFGYGTGRMLKPSELDRDPSSGNGGGEDILHSRRNDIIHPTGLAFTSNTVASSTTATLAELRLAVNWDRVMSRKNIGMAFLKHNN